MRTNDGHEVENGSSIYVAYPSLEGLYSPANVNMYDSRAHLKLWFHDEINCQKECDKLNKEKINQLK
jgi:hypothetical protein